MVGGRSGRPLPCVRRRGLQHCARAFLAPRESRAPLPARSEASKSSLSLASVAGSLEWIEACICSDYLSWEWAYGARRRFLARLAQAAGPREIRRALLQLLMQGLDVDKLASLVGGRPKQRRWAPFCSRSRRGDRLPLPCGAGGSGAAALGGSVACDALRPAVVVGAVVPSRHVAHLGGRDDQLALRGHAAAAGEGLGGLALCDAQ